MTSNIHIVCPRCQKTSTDTFAGHASFSSSHLFKSTMNYHRHVPIEVYRLYHLIKDVIYKSDKYRFKEFIVSLDDYVYTPIPDEYSHNSYQVKFTCGCVVSMPLYRIYKLFKID
jgi:hypothetical protein